MAQRLAILKADDFGSIPSENFRRLIEIGRKWQLPITIGIVGGRLSSMSKSEISYFRSCFEDELLEAWNHSATHRDLTTLSYEKQFEDIQLAQAQIRTALGVTCSTFGAPYNKYNADTIEAIQAIPDFNGVYLVDVEVAKSARIFNLPRNSLVSPEFVRPWSRQNHFNDFVRRCNLKRAEELLTVQFHPSAWNDHGFKEFERCLEYMLDQGFRFLNFAERIQLLENSDPVGNAGGERELTPRVRSVKIDAALEIASDDMKKRFSGDSRLSNFFFNRHVLGIQHVIRSLQRVTFGSSPEAARGDDHRVLDIGCGAGNWLTGYGVLHPRAQLFGLDKLEPCVEMTKASLAAAGMSSRAEIGVGSADDTSVSFPHRFSRVLCINAAQYMEKEHLFRFAHRVLAHSGEFLLNIQTPEYFVGAAWNELVSTNGNIDHATRRLETVIESLARHLGLRRRHSVYAYDERELMFMAKQNGLDALVAGIDFERPDVEVMGFPYLRTYLFQNRFLTQDKDNGYSSFTALPEDQRINLLNDLRNWGAWIRLRELVDNCGDAIPPALKADLTALSYSMTSEMPVAPNGEHSEFVKNIIAINSKSDSMSMISRASGNEPDVEILYPLLSYITENYASVVDFCRSSVVENMDSRIFVLGAAAACRLDRNGDAREFLQRYFKYRRESLL